MNDGDQIAALSVSENGDLPGRLWAFDEFSTNEDSSTADLATGLISLGFIRAALRRRAWLWCAATAIGLLAGLGLFIKVPPAYQASTSLLITNYPDEQAGDAALDNQAIAQSRTVAGDALRALGLRQSVTKFIGDYTVTVVTNRVL
ncbi:MAG: Wzz/FepE/Etk N-terminal domain-containing protein, partial [Streptosporangiaceae bacterium]